MKGSESLARIWTSAGAVDHRVGGDVGHDGLAGLHNGGGCPAESS